MSPSPEDWNLTLTVGDVRLAPDERRAENVPGETTMSWNWQGGPQDLETSLLRSVAFDGRERLYDAATVYAADGTVEWCGRLQEMPRSVDRTISTQNPKAQGWAVVGNDNRARREVFINRDLGAWGPPNLERQTAAAASWKTFQPGVDAGRLRYRVDAYAWTGPSGQPFGEMEYWAGPLKIAKIGGTWQSTGGVDLSALTQWDLKPYSAVQRNHAGLAVGADLITGTPSSVPQEWSYTPPAPRSLVGVYLHNTATASAATSDTYEISLADVYAQGDQGLPLYGTAPSNYGIKGDDAVRWLIETGWAGVSPGEIIDSGFAIPHLAFLEPQSDADIFNGINAFHGWAWGIWGEQPKLDWHPYGQGRSRRWLVRSQAPGVKMTQDGDSAASLFARIVVTYRNAAGDTVSVGPPGTQVDVYDESLQITDPTHPALARGVSPVYPLDLGQPCTLQVATAVGQMMLTQINATRRAGRATIPGYVMDSQGVIEPVYKMKGGDELVWTDIGDETPRRIVGSMFNLAQRTASLTFDTQLQTVEAWLQHIGASVAGRF